MKITIDTDTLSELDIAMLAFLADQGEATEEQDPEPEPPKPTKKAATKKAAAKVEPEPEPEEEDLVADEEEDLIAAEAPPTKSDAVAAATELVSNGGTAKVRAALEVVGAKRVTDMDDESVPAFMAALAAED